MIVYGFKAYQGLVHSQMKKVELSSEPRASIMDMWTKLLTKHGETVYNYLMISQL